MPYSADTQSGKATPRTRTLYSAIGKPAILRGFDVTTDIRPALEEAARKAKAGGKGKKRAREEEQEGEEETIETNRGSQVEEASSSFTQEQATDALAA
jgi:DNA topoisomerase VI subunit B